MIAPESMNRAQLIGQCRMLADRAWKAEARLATLKAALGRIQTNAASFHGDDAAKGRALSVIHTEASNALALAALQEEKG